MIRAPAGFGVEVPIDIGADPARDLARRELAKAVYQRQQPSLLQRVGTWLLERVEDFFRLVDAGSAGGIAGLAVVAVVLVLVVAIVRRRLGGPRGSAARARPEALFAHREHTAEEHRRAADEHAAAGRHAEAVRERMRAVVRGLEERDLLEPRSGRTAGAAAREAGRLLPDAAGPLADAARLFDETVYGGRGADASVDARMRAVDDRVRAARPVLAAGR